MATSETNMPICTEETFGPLAAIISFTDEEEMIAMANKSCFGLGASLWTENIEHAKYLAEKLESGMVTINGIVKSDPALPFGGTKKSGYGRELAAIGLKEFSNAKTITIHYIN
jgi:succinate-semialdehyde dehydrogenase/glutarate-semialdehyde dehydrogenase